MIISIIDLNLNINDCTAPLTCIIPYNRRYNECNKLKRKSRNGNAKYLEKIYQHQKRATKGPPSGVSSSEQLNINDWIIAIDKICKHCWPYLLFNKDNSLK